jgi:1-deoxy-D-xylulose-5-phosphate reductoisomerase
MRSVTILGASGSIGSNAIEFLRLHRDEFRLKNIAVKNDWKRTIQLCAEFDCQGVSFENEAAAELFAIHSSYQGEVLLCGPTAAAELASDLVDVVLAAISGSTGLPAILAAIRAGNRIALANKEALVCGGPELLDLAASRKAMIIPVDSEHSAIFQSMLAGERHEVSGLLLTASGGPFRTATIDQMRAATLEQALVHPNWSMGVKNTIDSATMANKGLELIEAAYLFQCDERNIEVLINPSSILHSAVSFRDGSMMAQLGRPDMRGAIGYGLSWPDRLETGVERLSLGELGRLEFEPVDPRKFPCLALARHALQLQLDGPLVFNAANEIAVAAFMAGQIGLVDIPSLIEDCLERGTGCFCGSLDDIPAMNAEALKFCGFELSRWSLRRHGITADIVRGGLDVRNSLTRARS